MSIVAIEVNSCYGKSMVAMEAMVARKSLWLLWKVTDCFEMPMIAIEITRLYGKVVVSMEATGCYESHWLL
jgi:hypothetical protein